MSRVSFLALALALALLRAAPVEAVPAPKPPEQLFAESDVVALVRVLSVTCTSLSPDRTTGEMLHGYNATLELLEVKKGGGQPGDTVSVSFKEIPKHIVGRWSVFYYPGEEVWTHLQRNDGGNGYQTTWWNARGEALRSAVTTELPTEIGETIDTE
jgi:hypothetical protein